MKKQYEAPVVEVFSFEVQDKVMGSDPCPNYCYVDCYNCYKGSCSDIIISGL